MEEFKYIEGIMEHETDRQIDAVAAVMWSMYWSIVKKELSRKVNLLMYQLIYVSTPTKVMNSSKKKVSSAGWWGTPLEKR